MLESIRNLVTKNTTASFFNETTYIDSMNRAQEEIENIMAGKDGVLVTLIYLHVA